MKKRKISNNLLWILFLVVVLYIFLSTFAEVGLSWLFYRFGRDFPPAVVFVNESYACFIGDVVILLIVCLIVRKNRFILRSFLPKGAGKDHEVRMVEDTYEPAQENTGRNLLIGLLLGFLTNLICILCAIIHGDIRLYLDLGVNMLPVLVYALLMVFVQSTSEELWCRGYLYERICIHYPLWVAVLVNGVFFGLLHAFNDNVTVFAVVNIVVCGIAFSLIRWYTRSIWMVMGVHTMWNFTQNFIFGLPNSGLASEASVLHLDAAIGVSNLTYDYEFGVEGALPMLVVNTLLVILCLILAGRDGRLGELRMSYEKKQDDPSFS